MNERLYRLQADNTARQIEMSFQRGRFTALSERHENGTAPKAISAFNLFQTPENIAERMVELARSHKKSPHRILEPSAGLGRILKQLINRFNSEIMAVEQSTDCMRELYSLDENVLLKQGDFLSMNNLGTFDIIVMNPPFKMGRDIKHIKHAASMLTHDGLLVSLCYDGKRQNKILKPLCKTWERLPAGSFKDAGTQADVVLLTIER